MRTRAGALGGDRVYRIHWVPGTDTLRGICHCGAERLAEDPVELWEWLLAHPEGHQGVAGPAPGPPRTLAMRE
ncbi:hypothetical protein ACLQ3D_26050 [Micromonospora vinacea]|uniref:Uncharacterized protein n=1 Tax=Micromonospora vinacea TaxID=709878 RepID=A0ABS0KAC3_9ACTN|nr:hypothetical protein [Micromonospora vinacea]MBG6105598.1 hypothetical protein [Micromonospora vinacea]WSZ78237.1 hypothetical protein OH804_07070 [Micromonospora sp. NBC_00860]WTA65336.1 hypothetical protein OHB51_22795 [Micromonospora sp. NBC_00855]